MRTIQSELKRHGIKSKQHEKPKKKEKLSERDLKELMGMNKPTYKRGSGGAWKQK